MVIMYLCLQLTFLTRHITMKHLLISKNFVELTKESLNSFISSKVNACGREVIRIHGIICGVYI